MERGEQTPQPMSLSIASEVGVIPVKSMTIESVNPYPYSYNEASQFGDGFPDRGDHCEKCQTYIPQFEGFGAHEQEIWRNLLKTEGHEAADDHIMALTGCSARWAKIWRLHPDGPTSRVPHENGIPRLEETAPCPFCGKALRTKKAKQCPHCFENWR